jgi:hypothetical protein
MNINADERHNVAKIEFESYQKTGTFVELTLFPLV